MIGKSKKRLVLATRKSPLALAQTELVRLHLQERIPETLFEVLRIVTTGDKQQKWSLMQKGGKGLFIRELEIALLEERAHLAIHSAKDLPTTLADGLAIAGYLPREVAHDVLVLREGCREPANIASGSPRRCAQARILYPEAIWREIRGNVETRLRKIAEGEADATILAAAGLRRLGLKAWPGLKFIPLKLDEIVPAAGQGAIAIECRSEAVGQYGCLFDGDTKWAVDIERLLLREFGGGCQSAFAAHFERGRLSVFHESAGFREYAVSNDGKEEAEREIKEIVKELKG